MLLRENDQRSEFRLIVKYKKIELRAISLRREIARFVIGCESQ